MNSISKIISILSSEEKLNFVSHLKQKNKRGDTKNIQLFKLLDTNTHVDNIDMVLYKKPAKGAYHALCKRLHDSLIDFIATKNLEGETSEHLEILKLLLASRIFFEYHQPKIAFKTLRKAEQKAKSQEIYSILNEVHYTQIQHAHLDTSQSLEVFIEKFKSNKKALQQEENLNLFYATVKQQLTNSSLNINQIITTTLRDFNIIIDSDLTYRSLYKILEITSSTAHLTHNYYEVFPFVIATYTQLSLKNDLKEHQLFYYIHILYYVANAYFRNKNFEASLQYLKEIEDHMHSQRKKYYNHFYPQFILLKTLNYNYTHRFTDAIELLSIFPHKKYKNQVAYSLDIKLCLIVFYFQQNEIAKAYQLFKELHHSDTWYSKKTDISWILKKNIIEILLHIELEHLDLVDSRLKSFKRRYFHSLKKNEEHQLITFLQMISIYHQYPEQIHHKNFTSTLNQTIASHQIAKEDIFIISLFAWLKAKVESKNLYQTTLVLTAFNKDI